MIAFIVTFVRIIFIMTFVRIIVSVSKLWPSSSYRLLLSMGILYSFSQYISYFDHRKIHFITVFFISVMWFIVYLYLGLNRSISSPSAIPTLFYTLVKVSRFPTVHPPPSHLKTVSSTRDDAPSWTQKT